jgi:glycosyltransferase involved in cell wall biosynthesis
VRVCFVLPSLRPSGGVAVARQHAVELGREHGVEVELVVLERGREPLPGIAVHDLAEARGRPYDIAIGTWWQTAAALWELDAGRRAILLQSFEQRFYDADAPWERLSAEATLSLPLDFVVVAPWIRRALTELRPEARSWVVPPGIDKETFAADREVSRSGPLRVLIEGQPTLPFKGVTEAVAAVGAMREPAASTLVALDPDSATGVGVDRVVGGLDAAGMAALYRESDVLLKLSRVEGLGLAPVEAFHSGVPSVLTPYTGHDEYTRHGENALIVGFDDPPGTSAALDLLARDRDLLARLSAGARETADRWPTPKDSTRVLHDALREIAEGEPPAGDNPLLLRTLALNTTLGRARLSRRGAATEHALTAAEALVRELSASRDDCGEMLEDARAQLARIQSSRAYRLSRAAKRAGRGLRRR